MINRYIKQNEHQGEDSQAYIIIGFKKTIIVIEQTSFSMLQPLFSINPNIKICFLSKINDIDINIIDKSRIIDSDEKFFKSEIENFNQELSKINSSDRELKSIWRYILPCITGYLIKEAYEKSNINRLNNFIDFEKNCESTATDLIISSENDSIPIINEDEFIFLRQIGTGTVFGVDLIYHIEREELYAQKKQRLIDEEIEKLRDREIENYKKVQHPFIPKLVGIGRKKEYLIIEFINGQTLSDINKNQLTFSEKITIFFEMLITIEYLHRKEFIYRDLKPNNVMIDKNKTVVLIDFDRMIKYEDSFDTTTKNFIHQYCAPEVNEKNFSYECDIYSLASVYLFMMDQSPNEIKQIIALSIKEEPDERPSIIRIIFVFYFKYHNAIQINDLFDIYLKNITEFYKLDETEENTSNNNDYCSILSRLRHIYGSQFNLGLQYMKGDLIPRDMNKCIKYFTLAANQNHVEAQFILGLLYEGDDLFQRDMNKSIYYYTLAANQNHVEAQFRLGLLYMTDDLIPRDMNKCIKYYTLAANQNHAEAQHNLGCIYGDGGLIPRDMNKSINYFSLAANQNHSKAQFSLGYLYERGELIPRDMEKSIYYYTLAANQNFAGAQFSLGLLYKRNELIQRDMEKSIYYYTLAANQNDAVAQFHLGSLYGKSDLIPHDINKCIKYYTLAANQNHAEAQYDLGLLYEKGELIPCDMNKSIYYYTLAAKQNHDEAQACLGYLYERGDLIKRDMNKSIYYYTLAAKQNNARSQYNLGLLYERGELIPRDMNKSIYYYTLAAKQNDFKAQLNLGRIYEKCDLIPRDMSKSIYYYTLAANQNHVEAQVYLGYLYSSDLFPRDMNKSIYYYTLAVNQNHLIAQFNLGLLYERGELIPRDMEKSIYYFTLAANQNFVEAQHHLGCVYDKGVLIPRDINKCIKYYTLAANQNFTEAQFNLGKLYMTDNSIPRDNNKCIHYISLAANQNHAESQLFLGYLYQEGEIIPRDINKCIHYYSLAANQNNAEAQFRLAKIYLSRKNVKKAIYYLTFSANQNHTRSLFFLALFNLNGLYVKKNPEKGVEYLIKCTKSELNFSIDVDFSVAANFIIGYFYHTGLYVQQDIKKAIKSYKEASSFKSTIAKNNLGIIYKNGIENEIKKELGWAIEYFKEAIKLSNHPIPMYNLAHLYFYEKPIENSNLESIKLLITSSKKYHYPSMFLLCIISIYEFGNDIKDIIKEIFKIEPISLHLFSSLCNIIYSNKLNQKSILKEKYEQYHNIDYIFDYDFFYSEYSKTIDFLENGIVIKEEENIAENINSEFYEGFGI